MGVSTVDKGSDGSTPELGRLAWCDVDGFAVKGCDAAWAATSEAERQRDGPRGIGQLLLGIRRTLPISNRNREAGECGPHRKGAGP